MTDRPVSATLAGAVILWLGSVALAAVYTAIGTRGTGAIAVILSAAGATLTIRVFLLHMVDDLIERERNAYSVGQHEERIHPVP